MSNYTQPKTYTTANPGETLNLSKGIVDYIKSQFERITYDITTGELKRYPTFVAKGETYGVDFTLAISNGKQFFNFLASSKNRGNIAEDGNYKIMLTQPAYELIIVNDGDANIRYAIGRGDDQASQLSLLRPNESRPMRILNSNPLGYTNGFSNILLWAETNSNVPSATSANVRIDMFI